MSVLGLAWSRCWTGGWGRQGILLPFHCQSAVPAEIEILDPYFPYERCVGVPTLRQTVLLFLPEYSTSQLGYGWSQWSYNIKCTRTLFRRTFASFQSQSVSLQTNACNWSCPLEEFAFQLWPCLNNFINFSLKVNNCSLNHFFQNLLNFYNPNVAWLPFYLRNLPFTAAHTFFAPSFMFPFYFALHILKHLFDGLNSPFCILTLNTSRMMKIFIHRHHRHVH